jgi:7-cyano-7-deazaguanine tRNA-ribosyltransferase
LLIVAGLTLKNLEPRVWDESSPYYLPELKAVMVSYAEFHQMPAMRRRAMERGLHAALGIPSHIKIFLDNGAFHFSRRGAATPIKEYLEFVAHARPDWYPIPQDFIPLPSMTVKQQRACLARTMRINRGYAHDGFVPVIHISRIFSEYVAHLKADERLRQKPRLALGGIVPHLLRAPKALSYPEILRSLLETRREFADKALHVFGIGGTATLHLAMLLGIDSGDSSGWRNRAARGHIQLPGSGERVVAPLGSWKGRELSPQEKKRLLDCACPACQRASIAGLKAQGAHGFHNRATHNLWVLLREGRWIEEQLRAGRYHTSFVEHLENSTYRPLVQQLVNLLELEGKIKQTTR